MDPLAQSLRAFRDSFYRCLDRRADALFELTDAILTAGSVPSPPHLRAWRPSIGAAGVASTPRSVWDAWMKEVCGACSLGTLSETETSANPSIYALDVSVWPRCDAETSPERGYYYHPSRHSAGQPIVAGWAYQLVAELGFERDSWVAPVDARRVRPAEDTDEGGCYRAGTGAGATATRAESCAHLRLRCRL